MASQQPAVIDLWKYVKSSIVTKACHMRPHALLNYSPNNLLSAPSPYCKISSIVEIVKYFYLKHEPKIPV